MALSLIEDIKTVSDLKRNLRSILQQVRTTGRPIIVTVNGRPDVVLMDVTLYERKLRSLNLTRLLAAGEEDVKKGRTRSARRFLKDWKRGKVSR